MQRFREIKRLHFLMKGRLAQLVQSICLTSRGSGVRIPQRPHLSYRMDFFIRAFSSAGSEHLPYKQRVGGSNPSTPTPFIPNGFFIRAFSSAGSEHLPYKQRVGGSNPSTPTSRQAIMKFMIAFFFFLSFPAVSPPVLTGYPGLDDMINRILAGPRYIH